MISKYEVHFWYNSIYCKKDENIVNDPYFYERQKQLQQDITEIDNGQAKMINNEDFWNDIDAFTQSLQNDNHKSLNT